MSRLVYGIRPVAEVLKRWERPIQCLLVSKKEQHRAFLSAAESRKIPIYFNTGLELDQLCGTSSHQGIVAVVGDYPYLNLHDLLVAGKGTAAPLLVVLDSVTDPQNLGAILRSALVLGATGIVLPKDRAAPITPTVVRVSAGASEHLPCARVTNLAAALKEMKQAGLWVAGAVERGGAVPDQADLAGPLALVLGNEQKGIRPLVQRGCDMLLTIPSHSNIASLNVAAAATALLSEVARQRRGQ